MIAQLARCAGLVNATLVHQSYSSAPFRFIEVRRGDDDGDPLAGKIGQRIPKFAP